MKQTILSLFDRLAHRAAKSGSFRRKMGDSFDIQNISFLKAAYESAAYYEDFLIHMPAFETDLDLISNSVSHAKPDGLFLEFGVASGRTIRHLASRFSGSIYGFDSFEGLPESWRTGFSAGTFAGNLPSVPQNVSLMKGWFSETLPLFLSNTTENVSYLHVDCDLYSSTKCIFELLENRIKAGTVIVFDEYWNYPGWRLHEFKAFEEFKEKTNLKSEAIGFVPTHQQVAFLMR